MAVCDLHFRKKSRFELMRPALIQLGAIAAVGVIAAATRFWHLGLRTFQGDETVYSLIANQVARGHGWEQSAVVHGPMQFFGAAAAFRMLGTSDFSARAMPAAFGVLLALLPLLFARHIGRAGAIVAALLLAVSPVMLYYSRTAGPDIYLAFFSLATAILIWRYLARPERAYLYLMAAALAFAAVTSEMALLVIAIFAAYLHYRVAGELIEQARAGAVPEQPVTHYERLGVARDASTRAIRNAYKAALDQRGKDLDRDAIVNAYQVLTSPNRREPYDRKLAAREIAIAERAADTSAGPVKTVLLAAGATPIAMLWPFIGGMRQRIGLTRLPDAASPLLVMVLLALPFYGPLVEKLPFVGDRGFEGQTTVYVVGGTTHIPGGELPVMWITLGALFAAAMVIGLAWKWHAWVVCWALFYGITITMFSGFFTDKGSIWTGIWGTLDYWWRPEARVADGPPYYYAMILPAYEIVPIAVAALGAALLAVRGGWRNRIICAAACMAVAGIIAAPAWIEPVAQHRTLLALIVASGAVLGLRVSDMTKFLAFWTVAAFFAFSAVGRKEPWLAVHIALPLALLAARLVNEALASFEMPPVQMPAFRMTAPRRLAQGAIVAAFVAGAAFSARTGVLASWGHGHVPQLDGALVTTDRGDTPIELIQPERVAPDVREVRATIERAAAASGQGKEMPIVVDTSYGFARGWLWYLRDYPNLQIEDMRRGYQVPAGAVALFDSRNRAKVRVQETATALTFTSSWSFPGDYRRLATGDIASDMTTRAWWSSWSRYLIDRTSAGQPDAVEGVAYFPQALSAALPASRQSNVLAATVEPSPVGPPAPAPAP